MGGASMGKTKVAQQAKGNKQVLISFLLGFLTATLLLKGSCIYESLTKLPGEKGSGDCALSFGKYHGQEYTSYSMTVGKAECLVESKFLKVQQHHVQIPGQKGVIPDWLWIDYHDRINVLVEAPGTNDGERKFLIFEQTKYALEDRQSLAIVGGIIEPGEQPEDAARREVEEELHVDCQIFQFLGRYRTDVNRGMGWTNTFLARDCQKAKTKKGSNGRREEEEVGVADTERQDVTIMTLNEVMHAVNDGRFLEIQWSATVALAMLKA